MTAQLRAKGTFYCTGCLVADFVSHLIVSHNFQPLAVVSSAGTPIDLNDPLPHWVNEWLRSPPLIVTGEATIKCVQCNLVLLPAQTRVPLVSTTYSRAGVGRLARLSTGDYRRWACPSPHFTQVKLFHAWCAASTGLPRLFQGLLLLLALHLALPWQASRQDGRIKHYHGNLDKPHRAFTRLLRSRESAFKGPLQGPLKVP